LLLRSAEGKPSSPRFLGVPTRLVRAGDGERRGEKVGGRVRGRRRRLRPRDASRPEVRPPARPRVPGGPAGGGTWRVSGSALCEQQRGPGPSTYGERPRGLRETASEGVEDVPTSTYPRMRPGRFGPGGAAGLSGKGGSRIAHVHADTPARARANVKRAPEALNRPVACGERPRSARETVREGDEGFPGFRDLDVSADPPAPLRAMPGGGTWSERRLALAYTRGHARAGEGGRGRAPEVQSPPRGRGEGSRGEAGRGGAPHGSVGSPGSYPFAGGRPSCPRPRPSVPVPCFPGGTWPSGSRVAAAASYVPSVRRSAFDRGAGSGVGVRA
jgi:hypothetical protein